MDVIFEGQMVIISHHTTCGVAATRVIEISRNTHTQEEAAARMMGRCCCRCYRKWLVSHAVQAAILDFEFSSLCLVTPALRSQIAACFVNYCRVIVIAASIFCVDKYKSKDEKRKTTHWKVCLTLNYGRKVPYSYSTTSQTQ